jgi:hypothetical protein
MINKAHEGLHLKKGFKEKCEKTFLRSLAFKKRHKNN